MRVKVIESAAEHEMALARMEDIWGAPKGTPEGDELDLLSLVVDTYETAHFPIPLPDPIEAIRFYMDQHGVETDSAMAELMGVSRARISELLSRRRRLTMDHIRRLHELGIPLSSLVTKYKLLKDDHVGPGATARTVVPSDGATATGAARALRATLSREPSHRASVLQRFLGEMGRVEAMAVAYLEAVDGSDPHVLARGRDVVTAWRELCGDLLATEFDETGDGAERPS